MKQVIRYKCAYCKKEMATVKGMERHEKHCIRNPNGFNCYMCKHAYLGTAYVDNPYTGGQSEVADKPICSLTEDWIRENVADRCTDYERSDFCFNTRRFCDEEVVPYNPFELF